MRFFNRAFFALLAALLGTAQAAAQLQPRAVGDIADRLDRVSRLNSLAMERGFTPRGSAFESAERVGAVTERVAAGVREFPVRRSEILGVDLDPASLEAARVLGFEVLRSFRLDALEIQIDVLRAPRGMSVARALRRLRRSDPQGLYEANSIFEPSEATPVERTLAPLPFAGDMPAAGARLGIIDTGIDADALAFESAKVAQRNFGRGEDVTPRAHGAAVAALARRYGAEELLIADAFSGEPIYADAEALARAIDWLAEAQVVVINMSVAGPPNAVLELAVARAVARGHVIVAAVGNDGPDSPPLYPAAYPDVIGVTAVDSAHRIYKRANRGEGVDIAAFGVDVPMPGAEGDALLTGTSYAAPYVSTFIATRLAVEEGEALKRSQALIAAAAIDLGEPGLDSTYGAGLLAESYSTADGAESR